MSQGRSLYLLPTTGYLPSATLSPSCLGVAQITLKLDVSGFSGRSFMAPDSSHPRTCLDSIKQPAYIYHKSNTFSLLS